MRLIARTFITCALLLGLLAPAGARAQVDLTGTWEGRAACSGADDGDLVRLTLPATLRLSQEGRDPLRASLTVARSPSEGFVSVSQCGQLAEPVPGKARVALGSRQEPQSVIVSETFSSVSVFPPNGRGESGLMRGSGTISIQGGIVLSCRYTLKRTSAAPPSLPGLNCDL